KALRKELGPAKCRITGTISHPKVAVRNASLVLRQHHHKEPIIKVHGVDLKMQVEDTVAGHHVLAVAPVEVFKNEKLSRGQVNGLLRLIAPDLQDDRRVGGTYSLALKKFRVPLGVAKDQMAKGLEAEGELTLHQVSAEVKNHMWRAMVKMVAEMNGKQAPAV